MVQNNVHITKPVRWDWCVTIVDESRSYYRGNRPIECTIGEQSALDIGHITTMTLEEWIKAAIIELSFTVEALILTGPSLRGLRFICVF